MIYRLLVFIFISSFFLTNCNKSSPFGAELLEDQLETLIFTDTATLMFTLEKEDSINTADPNSTAPFMLCGKLEDPIIGTSESEIYTGFQLSTLNPNFKDAILDSIVLFLAYTPSSILGDTLLEQHFEVTRLSEKVTPDYRYFSDTSIAVSTAADADLTNEPLKFKPTPSKLIPMKDSTSSVIDSFSTTYVRVRLKDSFGQELINPADSLARTSDTLFYNKFKGLRIKALQPAAMMGFDLNSSKSSKIMIYYKQNGLTKAFKIQFRGTNKFAHYTHNYTPYVQERLNVSTDSIVMLKGMAGLRVRVDMPYIRNFAGKALVNQADLVLYTATVPGDNPVTFPSAKQLALAQVQGDSTYDFIADVNYSTNNTDGGFSLFGGNPIKVTENNLSVTRYKLSMPDYLQDVILGKNLNKLYINLYPQVRSADRVLFYSPNSPNFKARLNLKYTLLQ